MKSIPELRQDYVIPKLFNAWDNSARENQGEVWHMLSLGASRSGLPFHVHGETWLGLVFGQKRWFLYPPGYGPPEETYASFVPIRRVNDWLTEVYPKLLSLPFPPDDFVTWEAESGAGLKHEAGICNRSYNIGIFKTITIQLS